MDVTAFERLVDWLSDNYTVVPLIELLDRAEERRSMRGLLALTFDDANKGFVRHGLPLLEARGFPSTVFVVSSMAAEPRPFWWDVMAARSALSAAERERYLTAERGIASEILAEAAGVEASTRLPDTYLPASWDELRVAVRTHEGVTVGAHTRRHPNLTRLHADELQDELTGARRVIAEQLDVLPEVVSYPYGLYDRSVCEAAAKAGYRAGLTLDPGGWTRRTDPLRIPRMNVPASMALPALECRLAGIRPGTRS